MIMPSISPSVPGISGRKNKSPSLPERVAQLYYKHGLFCSSYPFSISAFALTIALLCCYPLANIPLPGNMPQQVLWSKNESSLNDIKWDIPFTWAKKPPSCFIQQILFRAAVFPWSDNLMLTDAFRGPLSEAFKVLEIVRNHQDEYNSKTLDHLCLHVENVKQSLHRTKDIMPEYSCLLLSPANMWQNNAQKFFADTNILGTVYSHQNLQKGKISMAEVLFGMQLKDTGVKRYPIRKRLRIIQFAITIVLKEYDKSFISSLTKKLHHFYPLYTNISLTNSSEITKYENEVVHIYYPGEFNYYEFIPLIVAFILFFIYIYFSVRKIEFVKSKAAMAFSAVITVMLCLCMSVGICFFFGLTLSLQGKEVFPYLIILIGLENVLVLTKSVVSTPAHLDVKIRVAQGLSKEGWSITKNLLVEITILTFGLFTFIPAIQEFSIFAIVGLMSDFFLQMLFFSTVLAIDIRRNENIQRRTPYQNINSYYDKTFPSVQLKTTGLNRSKSHPRLSGCAHTNIVAGQVQSASEKKIPKRLRLVHIWARTRFFQRGFMLWMVVWISMLVYDSGIIENFVDIREDHLKSSKKVNDSVTIIPTHVNTLRMENNFIKKAIDENSSLLIDTVTTASSIPIYPTENTATTHYVEIKYVTDNKTSEDLLKLKHSDLQLSRKLSNFHWPAIVKPYNLSLSDSYITILPSIRISHIISPDQVIGIRNPEEKPIKHFQWSALAAALDPLDFNDGESKSNHGNFAEHMTPYYPTSPMEIMFATILCIISTVVLSYGFVVLYRCVCTRNYAEWRASWANDKIEEPSTQLIMEAVPTVMEGHTQQIECIATDGNHVVSTCLAGKIKIWDAITAEPVKSIDRQMHFEEQQKFIILTQNVESDENLLSDYESGSPPSRDELNIGCINNANKNNYIPMLQEKINFNFQNIKIDNNNSSVVVKTDNNSDAPEQQKPYFDFESVYKQLYVKDNLKQTNFKQSEIENWMLNNDNKISLVNGCGGERTTNSNEYINIYSEQQSNVRKHSKQLVLSHSKVPPIWCLDYVDNLIALGCSNGRIEFWEGTTGNFKCLFDDASEVGVTSIKIIANRVIAAKLNGYLDFLQLESYTQGKQIDWSFTSAYRRTHVRTGSAGSLGDCRDLRCSSEDLRCIRLNTIKAHQQPITVLDSEGGRVVTGSQDHTLKVFRLEDQTVLYTLHGHYGPITCLFIDVITPMMSGSGSQDGLLCVWDLLTGTCMYSIQAHDGAINSLTYSASYVISLGVDERLCVWERFQGHLLNTIHIYHSYASSMVMITECLLVTAKQGSLTVWDVRTGDTIRKVTLGDQDSCVFVKQILHITQAYSVVCDYGNQLRIVRFPLVHDKFE